MSDFLVHPAALETFAVTSEVRSDHFSVLKGNEAGYRVERGSFGYIPFIGERAYSAYDEFVTGLAEALGEASQVMAAVGQAVQDSADAYKNSDGASEEALIAIEQQLDVTIG